MAQSDTKPEGRAVWIFPVAALMLAIIAIGCTPSQPATAQPSGPTLSGLAHRTTMTVQGSQICQPERYNLHYTDQQKADWATFRCKDAGYVFAAAYKCAAPTVDSGGLSPYAEITCAW